MYEVFGEQERQIEPGRTEISARADDKERKL